VFVLGRIAAADVAACQTEAQMYPVVADGQALLASLRSVAFAVQLLRSDGAEMLAIIHRGIVTPK
jgi:hypothetical protein